MNSLKHDYFAALLLLLLIPACKKNKNPEPVILEQEREPDPVKPPIGKALIPVKFETTGLTLSLKYQDNTNLLTEIADASGNRTVIKYNADQFPSELEKYKNGKLFYTVYYEIGNKKAINKALIFETDGSFFTPLGSYILSYNTQQELNEIRYYDHANQLTHTQALSYLSGKLSEETNNKLGSVNINTYTFDQKKGISSQIIFNQIIAIEYDHWFLSCNTNNVLSIQNQESPLENIRFTYEYNEDGYPSSMTITKNQSTQNIKITYKPIGH